MLLLRSPAVAFVLMMFSVSALGTWPVIFKSLTRKGIPLPHQYMDFSLGTLLVALVISATVGTYFGTDQPDVIPNVRTAGVARILFAVLGGAALSGGNLLLVLAMALTNSMTIAVPIQAAFTVGIGSAINHWLEPGLASLPPLIIGVVFFAGSWVCGALAYQDAIASTLVGPNAMRAMEMNGPTSESDSARHSNNDGAQLLKRSTGFESTHPRQPWERRGPSDRRLNMGALSICVACGLVTSLFPPCFSLATMPDNVGRLGPRLTPYAAFLLFSASFATFSFLINVVLLYEPLPASARSSCRGYCSDSCRTRMLALAAGVLCGMGVGTRLIAGRAAGFPAADMIADAHPMIAGLWGMLWFDEYADASRRTHSFIRVMYSLYIAGITAVGCSFI